MLLPSGDLVFTLTIGGLLQHNGTTIQCLAESLDQSSTAVTPNAIFLIQGESAATFMARINSDLVKRYVMTLLVYYTSLAVLATEYYYYST